MGYIYIYVFYKTKMIKINIEILFTYIRIYFVVGKTVYTIETFSQTILLTMTSVTSGVTIQTKFQQDPQR